VTCPSTFIRLHAEELQCQQPGIEVVEGIESFLTCSIVFYTIKQLPELTPSLSWFSNVDLTNSVQTPGSNISYVQ
jgi:hypothetical protein